MGTSNARIARRIERTIHAVLPPGAQAAVKANPAEADTLIVSIAVGTVHHSFTAAWLSRGGPADVTRYTKLYPKTQVLVAPTFTTTARDHLAQQGIGWVDEAGGASIALPTGLLISRESTVKAAESPHTAWTSGTTTVAEALLAGTAATTKAVETATGLAHGTTVSAMRHLEALGLLRRPGPQRGPESGRKVADSDRLLREYAAAAARIARKQAPLLFHRIWRDPIQTLSSEVAETMARHNVLWAVTGPAASTLLSPFLTEVTSLDLYVDEDTFANVDRLAGLLGARRVDRGHRIEVRKAPTRLSTSGPKVGEVQVALPVRVFADLMAKGDRWEEAAEHLKENVIDTRAA